MEGTGKAFAPSSIQVVFLLLLQDGNEKKILRILHHKRMFAGKIISMWLSEPLDFIRFLQFVLLLNKKSATISPLHALLSLTHILQIFCCMHRKKDPSVVYTDIGPFIMASCRFSREAI